MASKVKAKPLSEEEIYKNIQKLRPSLREKAKKTYESNLPARHGSAYEARQLVKKGKSDLAVTADHRREMARMYADGASYRAIEAIQHLRPASGNDVYRQIDSILHEDRKLAAEVKSRCKTTGQTVPKAARNAKVKK